MHAACAAAISAAGPPLLLSPFVLAELDNLLATRVGPDAELALLREVARGAYQLEPFDADDLALAMTVIEKYADHEIGLAEASLVVLAKRHETRDVLTLDHRHFDDLKTLDRRPRAFRIVP